MHDLLLWAHNKKSSHKCVASHKNVISLLHEEMAAAMDLIDEQRKVLEPLPGEMPPRADGRGRPWPGWAISVASSPATSAMRSTSWASFNLAVSLSCSG